jgi:uncharacterized protein YheU (UPF0270 family)
MHELDKPGVFTTVSTKVGQVRHQLNAGTAVIIYDEATDSWTIQPTDQLSGPP